MPDRTVQASSPPAGGESQNKSASQSDAILRDIRDMMHDSDVFPRTGKDAPSRFWSAYERVAKQYDDEFIERHNGDMDVLLIFAGLFSAISSAFIVNMQSSLSPSSSDTTNSLLKVLINKIDNSTFPAQEATLPVWTGPSSATIWIQTLAYTSLSSSLLAAFGGVLGKQWLGHFKTSRFGRGSLHERCQRRQQKLDALEGWHFSMIISTLPILLQLSLLFFGIALGANLWTLQQTVASVIMATTTFGFIFYFFTVVSSLKSPDCPFQTPVSTMIQHIFRSAAAFQLEVRRKWKRHPRTWAGFLDVLRQSSRNVLCSVKDMITKSIALFLKHFSRLLAALSHKVRSLTYNPEVPRDLEGAPGDEKPVSEATRDQTLSSDELSLGPLELPVEITAVYAVQSNAIQWILETSTDTDIIVTAAGMLPEIEWPAALDKTGVLDRLKSHFYACFDPSREILPLSQAWAVTCLKAMCHFCIEQDLDNPLTLSPYGDIFSNDWYHILPDQAFLVVLCAVDKFPVKLDIASLPLSDRIWMARMFTYRLHKGEGNKDVVAFVIDFIGICLDSASPARLVADCLLLAGMLIGLQIHRRDLATLDKSKVIGTLRESVMNRMLAVLVDEIQKPSWHRNALTLVYPLLQDFDTNIPFFSNSRISVLAFQVCFRLLKEDSSTMGNDQVRSNSVALFIRLVARTPFLLAFRVQHTPEQFDLLVDYHLRICEGTEYEAVKYNFKALEWLGGWPSTTARMRRYIDTTIHFMGQETTRSTALIAALAVRSEVVSIGRDDVSFRERFSTALSSAVLGDAQHTALDDNPFAQQSFFTNRDIPYLRLLCILSQEPIWHPQLHQNGHFNNCLAIAKTLSPRKDAFFNIYTVPVAHIFAIIHASDKEHPFFSSIQAYPCSPLILKALRYTFSLCFFGGMTTISRWGVSTTECLSALPFIVDYARTRFDDEDGPLMALVEKIRRKLDDEKLQGDFQHVQDDSSFGEMPVLGKQIHELLDASVPKLFTPFFVCAPQT